MLIFDLAYFKYRRFARIDDNGGYFVSRLKRNTKPEIVTELREWRGRAIPLEGEQIFEIAEDLYRKYVDVEVEVAFRCGPYAVVGHEAIPRRRRPRCGRRRRPLLHHEPAARVVLAGGYSDDVLLSVGSRVAVS